MKFNELYFEKYFDIFGYHKEIQTISKGFRLYYNKLKNKISIINIYNNYEICYEFSCVLEINLQILRFYKIENYNLVLNHVDEFNSKKELSINKSKSEIIKYCFSQFNLLNKRQLNTKQTDINKIIGATVC